VRLQGRRGDKLANLGKVLFSERQADMVSAILTWSSPSSSTEQVVNSKLIQLSNHCLSLLLPSSRLPHSTHYIQRSSVLATIKHKKYVH